MQPATHDAKSPVPRPADEITALDALSLSRRIAAREVRCTEVMAAYLDRIDALNPAYNALVSVQPREALMAEAAARDAMLDRGESLGWMHGIPQAIKDLSATRGIRTTQGSRLYENAVPKDDAIFVRRMRESGAILVGKTNTAEFGLGSQTYNDVFGTTLNAFDPRLTAGGSSGGAAVALALNLLPVADGSDHAGSLRNPAAFNGVYGFRPTLGLVPTEGRDVALPALGVVGPMARTVPDLALLLSVQSGYDPASPGSSRESPARFLGPLRRDFAGARVGWLGDLGGHLPFEDGILDLCRGALGHLAEVGCVVEEADAGFEMERVWKAWTVLRAWMTGGALKDRYMDPAKRALMKPEACWEVEEGLRLQAMDVYDASAVRASWLKAVGRLFRSHDFLVLPSAQVFPFDASVTWPREIAGRAMDTYHRWMEVVIPVTMAGCPVVNVPVGFSADGRPMGMQVFARPHEDLACLQLAAAYEAAYGDPARRH